MNSSREFICLKEAAEILGVDRRVMAQILKNNKDIHYTRTKRKILINKLQFLNYIKNVDIIKYYCWS